MNVRLPLSLSLSLSLCPSLPPSFGYSELRVVMYTLPVAIYIYTVSILLLGAKERQRVVCHHIVYFFTQRKSVSIVSIPELC